MRYSKALLRQLGAQGRDTMEVMYAFLQVRAAVRQVPAGMGSCLAGSWQLPGNLLPL